MKKSLKYSLLVSVALGCFQIEAYAVKSDAEVSDETDSSGSKVTRLQEKDILSASSNTNTTPVSQSSTSSLQPEQFDEDENNLTGKLLEECYSQIKPIEEIAQEVSKNSNELTQSFRTDLMLKSVEVEEQLRTQLPSVTIPKDKTQIRQHFGKMEEFEAFCDFFNKEKKYASILSLDGGGFRGLMEAYWLAHLEKKDVANRKPHQLFNLIAGTSIGGILALAATIPGEDGRTPILSTENMIDLFVKKGNEIFPHRWEFNYPMKLFDKVTETLFSRYSERPLEELLISTFSSQRLNTALTPVVVTTAVADKHQPFLFSSFEKDTRDYMAYEVGRATSAAPTYFRSYPLVLPGEKTKRKLVDGGLWYNNPAQIAHSKTTKWARESDFIVLPGNTIMLSLGTGLMPIEHVQPDNAGWVTAARPLIESMMTISSEGVHKGMVETLPSENYKRINPIVNKNIELDNIGKTNIDLLRKAAEAEYENIETFVKDGRLRLILERDEIN